MVVLEGVSERVSEHMSGFRSLYGELSYAQPILQLLHTLVQLCYNNCCYTLVQSCSKAQVLRARGSCNVCSFHSRHTCFCTQHQKLLLLPKFAVVCCLFRSTPRPFPPCKQSKLPLAHPTVQLSNRLKPCMLRFCARTETLQLKALSRSRAHTCQMKCNLRCLGWW